MRSGQAGGGGGPGCYYPGLANSAPERDAGLKWPERVQCSSMLEFQNATMVNITKGEES